MLRNSLAPATSPRRPAHSRSWPLLGLVCTLWSALWLGCAAPEFAQTRHPRAASPQAQIRLTQAAEAFYLATTPEELQAALAFARAAGPDTPLFHELAAEYSRLQADDAQVFEHLYLALTDLSDDAADLHLVQLDELAWTFPERDRALALFRSLAARHPRAAVRSRSIYLRSLIEHSFDDKAALQSSHKALGLHLRLAAIGSWDNDQGKAFDTALPPELGIDLDKLYEGSLLPIGWRQSPAGPSATGSYRFASLFSPAKWAVGYGLAAVSVQRAERYELRVKSSVPTKVWVDNQLVYQQRRIDTHLFDQLVIPLQLAAGPHRILIKSAQNTGSWLLSARLTGPGGLPASGLQNTEFDTALPPPKASPPHVEITSSQMLDTRVAHLDTGPVRTALLRWRWATAQGFPDLAVELGDSFVAQHPKSLVGRYALSLDLWNDSQRDRTSDLLTALDTVAGDALPLLRLEKATLLGQEGLTRKARELLLSVRNAHPQQPEVWRRLAQHFQGERWLKDRCKAWGQVDKLRPKWPFVLRELGDCLTSQGFRDHAAEAYSELLAGLPHDAGILSRKLSRAIRQEHWEEAEAIALSLTKFSPERAWTWRRLSGIYRLQGKTDEAHRALQRALDINPDDAGTYYRMGKLAYEFGDTSNALRLWRLSLDRNPDDERLSNRLRFLAPDAREAWEQDVPSEEQLDAAVALAANAKPAPGANLIEALDHEVSRFNPDGTSVNVVTQVLRAVNDSGRDQLLKLSMRYGGRLRVLHAYAVSPSGKRTQVSSTRNRTARFRGLAVGSTIVLQYRHDASAAGYLSRHVARSRTFQGSGLQTLRSNWTVWAARSTQFHEWLQGDIQRDEQVRDDLVRISWSATNLSPVVPEPYMPRANETNARMLLSTVPDWDTFLRWEKALLVDAFRDNAEVRALARKLLDSEHGIQAKIERIHRYLMEDIRYQQDYETHIAGVKPHPASVVTRRGYGDCKDKAVLFISLARLAGIEVHFAILRTRPKGPLRRDVPMQQFNHAIVYVPAQPGVAAGRFYDPTADALDIDVLRADDPGALALVLNTTTNQHSWIEIPYQAPSAHHTRIESKLKLTADGQATGTLHVTMQGSPASGVRRLARNPERLTQAMQRFVGSRYSGATVNSHEVEEAVDLSKPAALSLDVTLPAFARLEGEQLRIRLPPIWSNRALFQLVERQYPLVLGAPRSSSSVSEVQLPPGTQVVRLPSAQRVVAPCFVVSRTVSQSGSPDVGSALRIEQTFDSTCERIAPKDYALHRRHAEQISKQFLEEIVVRVP